MVNLSESVVPHCDKLDGQNYGDWLFILESIIMGDDRYDIVIGTEVQNSVASSKVRHDFEKSDRKAWAYTWLSVKKNQIPLIKEAKTSKEAWDAFKKKYETPSRCRKMMLKAQVHSIKMIERSKINSHLSAVREIIDQLASLGAATSEVRIHGNCFEVGNWKEVKLTPLARRYQRYTTPGGCTSQRMTCTEEITTRMHP